MPKPCPIAARTGTGNIVISFTIANPVGCKNHTVNFTNTCTGSSRYRWFFGDGGTTQLTSPNYTDTDTGLFDVQLIAADPASGCRDTVTQTAAVRVNGIGIDFTGTPLQGCVPHDVTFNTTSRAAFGATITSLTWDFGDPNNTAGSNLPSPPQ